MENQSKFKYEQPNKKDHSAQRITGHVMKAAVCCSVLYLIKKVAKNVPKFDSILSRK